MAPDVFSHKNLLFQCYAIFQLKPTTKHKQRQLNKNEQAPKPEQPNKKTANKQTTLLPSPSLKL